MEYNTETEKKFYFLNPNNFYFLNPTETRAEELHLFLALSRTEAGIVYYLCLFCCDLLLARFSQRLHVTWEGRMP